jgi:hypothetical protein
MSYPSVSDWWIVGNGVGAKERNMDLGDDLGRNCRRNKED